MFNSVDRARLERVESLLCKLTGEFEMSVSAFQAQLDTVSSDVTSQGTVVGSVQTLLSSLSSQLAAAIAQLGNSGVTAAQLAELTAIQQGIEANNSALAAAVVANTPAAPAAPAAATAAPAAAAAKPAT